MRNLILVIIATVGLIAGGIFLFQKSQSPSIVAADEKTAAANVETSATEKITQSGPVDIFYYENDSDEYSLKHAMSERYIGSLDAPVVFYDFSSLSCPHCAKFHTEILPKIKKNFIETGQVRMIFASMPLNITALMGEQVARCLPKKDYYKIISLLYKNQELWAFTNNPKASLVDILKLAGVKAAKSEMCINDEELQASLNQATRDNAVQYGIKSTPSFVFEDGARMVSGVNSYEFFEELLNDIIEKKSK